MGKAYHQADGHHGPDFTTHQVAEEEEVGGGVCVCCVCAHPRLLDILL